MKRKTVLFLLTFVVIYVFNFFVPRLMPGDVFSYMEMARMTDPGSTTSVGVAQMREAMLEYYGMDKPLGEQFLNTIKRNFSGDLGNSIYYKLPVWSVISSRLPWSLYIMGSTLILSLMIGVALAFCGLRRKKLDTALFGLNTVLAETPAFLVGILLLFLIAAKVKWIPLSGAFANFARYDSNWDKASDILVHSLMPITAMILVTVPSFYFTARTSFLTVLNRKYILTAKAKGLSKPRVSFRYILLNAMAPIVARFFLSVGACLGSTLLIENVFAYPGLGKLMRDAVNYRDYPLIQGIFLISTIMVLVCSFISDVISDSAKERANND